MSPYPNRPSRRSAKGQAMAIFALVAVLLFVVAGLSIDAGTSYLTSNRIERAAAAAALAGVTSPVTIPMLRMPHSSRLRATGTQMPARETHASGIPLHAWSRRSRRPMS
jgi:uncharacterized membrane protein